jgi:hypothetical protein
MLKSLQSGVRRGGCLRRTPLRNFTNRHSPFRLWTVMHCAPQTQPGRRKRSRSLDQLLLAIRSKELWVKGKLCEFLPAALCRMAPTHCHPGRHIGRWPQCHAQCCCDVGTSHPGRRPRLQGRRDACRPRTAPDCTRPVADRSWRRLSRERPQTAKNCDCGHRR